MLMKLNLARLRDLHSYSLKANYMQCEDCLKRQVARQEVDIYLEVLFQTVLSMMKDCDKLSKKCYQYAIRLQVSFFSGDSSKKLLGFDTWHSFLL